MCHVIQEKRVLSDNFQKQMVELTEVVLVEIHDNILPVRPYLRRKPYVVATSQSYLVEKQGSEVLNLVGGFVNSLRFYHQTDIAKTMHCQSYRQVTINTNKPKVYRDTSPSTIDPNKLI